MNNILKIAVDAMGGDNAPNKIIDGIIYHNKNNKKILYRIFGNKNIIEPLVLKSNLNKENYEIIHTEEKIEDEDSPLSAAKRGKNTSMWLAIESVKDKTSDIAISAGNTGALFVISKLNLNMIENIAKIFGLSERQFLGIKESRKGSDKLNPYVVLESKPDDDISKIRKKYIILSKEHHPDLLLSKGVPQEIIEESKNKMRAINSAWDQVQKLKKI